MNAESAEPARRRLTRAEAKARTRALLLDAAARVFARKGFTGASVEEIAEAAGFSIGALYSNFGSKEALFLELLADRQTDRIAEAAQMLECHPSGTGEAAAELGRLLIDVADKDTDFAPLQAEFWLYAVRNPEVLETMAANLRTPRRALQQVISTSLAQQDAPAEVSAEAVATVVAALFTGLVRQRRIDPASVPEELFGDALKWLFAGINASGAAPSGTE
ncbi:TetR/AcrR family transcriptional regulator [Streptomyces platensis]|uniref:HTH-type transcriptional repressor NicS n=1 Tax=Streptomyces platensis TaxID=58346 RepID=A0AAE6NLT1_STRPT|nr:TetR/AcrR family transcriptional regulator [Streptomyces platensis]OSY42993.1 HTH-type transcriptional repressor NicS [Streptomyces platensis]QEV54205.1 TetR/AcrR family transcriptional regulator [Streptomyces platensis]